MLFVYSMLYYRDDYMSDSATYKTASVMREHTSSGSNILIAWLCTGTLPLLKNSSSLILWQKRAHVNNAWSNLCSSHMQPWVKFICESCSLIQSGLTFVTVMQNQGPRSRPVSPSSKEQCRRSGKVMRRRGGQLCWICRERAKRGGDRQVSVSGSLSTEGLIAAAVK